MPFPDEPDALPADKADNTVSAGDHAAHHNALAAALNRTQQALLDGDIGGGGDFAALGDVDASATIDQNVLYWDGIDGKVKGVPAVLDVLEAKGDLLSATGADAPARLALGDDDDVLTVDSAEPTGLKWAPPAAGGGGGGLFVTYSAGDWIYPPSFAAPGAQGTGNGWIMFAPIYIGQTTTVDRIGCNVALAGPAGSTVRLGLYADSAGKPAARILDSGTIAIDTTGLKSATIAETLAPGVYWTAVQVVFASGSPQITGIAGSLPFVGRTDQAGGGGGWRDFGSGALPATGAAATRSTAALPVATLRKA